MLPLPVSYYCSQQQCNDGHEVKVPLRSQKLVHVNLGEHISNLNEKDIKIIIIMKTSEKELGKVISQIRDKYKTVK